MSSGFIANASDFFVEELPLYAATGEGGHTFVFVQKESLNTEDVANVLARVAGVAARDVGYAGRKDRMAVTRQYFSVPGLDPEVALAIDSPGIEVLSATRHPHKLRTGQLAGNRFAIRVDGVGPTSIAELEGARERLLHSGLPNRFGDQRFGRAGSNVESGKKVLSRGLAGRDRRQSRFVISALQAAVFNAVLSRRPVPLDRVECGDVARRCDSGGLFVVEDEAVENERAARFEISATGPIFGTRMEAPSGAVADRERDVLTEFGIDMQDLRAPKGVRLRGGRRPFRVAIADLAVEVGTADQEGLRTVKLDFSLPGGSYATVAMEELLGSVPDRAPHASGAWAIETGEGMLSP